MRVNTPPQVLPIPKLPVATVEEPYTLPTSIYFSDDDTLTYSIEPENLRDNFSTATGVLTFTPAITDASQMTLAHYQHQYHQ